MNELSYFLVGLSINILLWWVRPAVVKRFFVRQGRKLLRYIYISVACLLSLYFLFTLIFVFPTGSFQQIEPLNLIALYILTLLAMLGIWMPVFQYIQNKRAVNIIYIVGACLSGVLFIIFWIIQWPKWQISALLTVIVVFMLILLLVYSLIEKRKTRRLC